MTRTTRLLLVAALVFVFVVSTAAGAGAAGKPRIREPAVAGLFYPKNPDELARTIDTLLADARTEPDAGELKALICPHAGYAFSGPIAASAFRLLAGRQYRTVFVLAPSHYAFFRSASVTDADVFRTPLGDVPIAAIARRLAQVSPYVLEPRVELERPEWAAASSRSLPPPGTDTADTWEHADEVEVPFLQRTLKEFAIVPVVFGDADPSAAARALIPLLDRDTLVVASSDLSHYHTYAEAEALDRATVDAICSLDVNKLAHCEACGRIPVVTLVQVAKQLGWRPRLLDYRNSGDTSGQRSRVVGYAAIAFFAPAARETFSASEKVFLLQLARRSLYEAATTGHVGSPAVARPTGNVAVPRGCFVTLTRHGRLRGCIGNIEPAKPLYEAVADNTLAAALRDPRFPAVSADEAKRLEIEISVLTPPQPLTFSSPDDLLRKLNAGEDGVVLTIDGRRATFLPQVWQQLPDKVEFLNALAEKAGCETDAWRGRNVSVSIYHVESFSDSVK